MKISKIVLVINLLIFSAMIGCFTWGMMVGKVSFALTVKPFVAWSFMLFFGAFAVRFPELKSLAWRLVGVFFMYGVGDIVMEMGTDLTPAGMGLFFVGHILYIVSIFRAYDLSSDEKVTPIMQPSTRKVIACIGALLLFGSTTFAVICVGRSSGDYLFCLGAEIYAQLFTTATIVAALKYRRGSSMIFTILGSFVYAASDICIATQRFIFEAPWMVPFVMVTYWSAVLFFALAFFPIFFHVHELGKEKPKEQ